ncbi:MAG: peptidoglycan DD-metalloendopeptidase family protein [bacterium]
MARIFLLFLFCIFLSRCTWPGYSSYKPYEKAGELSAERYHILKRGETLWRVAKKYDVPLDDIIRYNNIDDVTKLPVGTKIYIPAQRDFKYEEVPDFIWPLKGTIIRGFKHSGPILYPGIDILSPEGTPILAAASGDVIYNGNHMAGYGNMIIIKHSNGFSSVYANNKVNLVKVGERVVQGQIVARVGKTGDYGEPYLHFEIRKEKKSLNPRLYLPSF